MITNPLSMKARGQLYVAAIVVGAVTLVVTAILTTLGMEPWIPVVSSVASAMSVLAGSDSSACRWRRSSASSPGWRATT